MNYIYTLKDYNCNKHCPYCITKIINRQEPEDIDKLKVYLSQLQDGFEDFILSGNGEPSLYSFKTLKSIKNVVEYSNKFKSFRIQTSGLLFNQPRKLELFDGWVKEITVISYDPIIDKRFFKYSKDYLHLTYFRDDVRCNYTMLLENYTNKEYMYHLALLLGVYNNIAIKLLDTDDKWVVNNGVPYTEYENIIENVSNLVGVPEAYNTTRGRYEWMLGRKTITMSYGKYKGFDKIQIEEKYEHFSKFNTRSH